VFVQVAFAYLFGHVWTDATWSFFFVAYVVGGSLTGLYGVILHEATHNLCSASPVANRWIGLLTNVGLPVPIAQSFRRHHLEHHTYQGVIGKVPDLPLDWEVRLIRGSTWKKSVVDVYFPGNVHCPRCSTR